MELHGNYREAVINYAICELCLGQDTIALQAVTEALSNNRDYPTLLLMRGVIYACQGDEAKALRDFRDLRDNNVEFSQFIYNAVLKLMQGKQTSFAGNIVKLAVHYEVCDHETAALLAKTEGLC
jgi:tetratricopeptide (TPR) repeat protein